MKHIIFGNQFGGIRGLEELDDILEILSHDTKIKIRNMIQDHIKEKIKETSRKQFLEIPANCLKQGDLILDLKCKYLQRIEYVSAYDATHSNQQPNTICICYGENYDCDNVSYDAQVYIFIDPAEYVDRSPMNGEYE